MIKYIVAITGVALLSACATTANYQQTLDTWQGATADQLIDVWGYPDEMKDFEGNQLYVYDYQESGRNPVYVSPGMHTARVKPGGKTVVRNSGPTISGGGTYDNKCTTTFEVDKDKKIIRASSRGNDCTGTSDFVKQFSH